MTLAELRTADNRDAAMVKRATPIARRTTVAAEPATPTDVAVEYLLEAERSHGVRAWKIGEDWAAVLALRSTSLAEYARGEFVAELGRNLQRERLARGMSQEHLAYASGLSWYTYQKYEKGESRPRCYGESVAFERARVGAGLRCWHSCPRTGPTFPPAERPNTGGVEREKQLPVEGRAQRRLARIGGSPLIVQRNAHLTQ
jgi:hypothetical protein